MYTKMCSESGEWTGEEAVKERVLAACAKAQMDMDKAAADKNKQIFAWDMAKANTAKADDPVAELLAKAGLER